MRRISLLALAALAVVVPSCDDTADDQTYRIAFDVVFDGAPFRCGGVYEGVGTTQTTVEPLDVRMYIHDVALLTSSGEQIPLQLNQDEQWQRDEVVLLDFADDTGRCQTGSPQTNMEIVGTAAARHDVVGVAFTLGLPAEDNHIDAVRSPAPYNAPGMWWSWTGGFKYARIDVATPVNPQWYIHLGATSCDGNPAGGFSCAWDNIPRIELDTMDPMTQSVVLDLASLYEGSDLEAPIDYQSDFVNGCMAFSGDPECAPIFERLGVEFEGPAQYDQSVFSAR